MVIDRPAQGLLGRGSEIQVPNRLFRAVRGRDSGALVVRGEPGIGKTALVQHVVESAAGVRIPRAVGVESEMELPSGAAPAVRSPA